MEELPRDEINRILDLLLKDEAKRNRLEYTHTNDVLVQNSITPFSIWPLPNADVARIHAKEVGYDDLPFEDQNEAEKGMLFGEQRGLVAERCSAGKEMLCEARDYQSCACERCPMFVPLDSSAGGGRFGICREYKLAFRK